MSFISSGCIEAKNWNLFLGDIGSAPPCTNGPVWTQEVVGNHRWRSVASSGANKFVALGVTGINNFSMRSSDGGDNWIENAGPAYGGGFTSQIFGMAYGNGIYMDMGSFVSCATSPDEGVTWNVLATPGFGKGGGTFFFNGFFYVTENGAAAVIHRTVDGTVWTAPAMPSNDPWLSMAYNGSRIVCVASNGKTAKSDDNGVTWTAGGLVPGGSTYGRCAYGNGAFVVCNAAGATDTVYYSLDDGASWTAVAIGGGTFDFEIKFQQGVFLILNTTGQAMRTSRDGITWNTVVNEQPPAVGGNFVGYAYDGAGHYATVRDPGADTVNITKGLC